MTSSTRNFVDAGSTSPVTRLITIRRNPRASRRRRGRISAQTSGSALNTEIGGPLGASELDLKCTLILSHSALAPMRGGIQTCKRPAESGPLLGCG